MKGAELNPKDHNIQIRHFKQRLLRLLRATFYKRSVVRQEKRLHRNILELKALPQALKNQAKQLPHHSNSPRDALDLDLVQL